MKKGQEQFKKIYQSLNPSQRRAVDAIEGPVTVVAGPGTGKTHVLAARIANILLSTDTPPSAIQALTFTDSAAVNMRARLVNMIGPAGHYVNIATFHSFCTELIKSNPEYFPIDRDSEPMSVTQKYQLFEEIIASTKLKALKPLGSTMFYLPEIISSISDLKREGIAPEQYYKIIDSEFEPTKSDLQLPKAAVEKKATKRVKNQELLIIYQKYQQLLNKRHLFDFDDMIMFVITAFVKHQSLLADYQERLHYFLVDEFQDTNTAQYQIVQLLTSYWGARANLFVVGDPNQAIFRFQGASVENLSLFISDFPKAPIINLELSYRSPTLLLEAAYGLTQKNLLAAQGYRSEAIEKKLGPALNKKIKSVDLNNGEPIDIIKCDSQVSQYIFVAEKINELLKKKVSAAEIAILYRNNADAPGLQQVLDKWSLQYSIEGGENILATEPIKQLLTFLRTVDSISRGEENLLFDIMCFDWTSPNPTLAMKIARAASKANLKFDQMIELDFDYFHHYDFGGSVEADEFRSATNFLHQLFSYAESETKETFSAWFEKVIKDSGYLQWIKNKMGIEHLINLNSLYSEIKLLNRENNRFRLADFLTAVTMMEKYRLPLFAQDLSLSSESIYLSTVHKAKGREWSYVFLIDVVDGKWGNLRARNFLPLPDRILKNTDITKKQEDEDERRLFYVALTRAKKKVTICYPETVSERGRSKTKIPSMFTEEIEGQYVDRKSGKISGDQKDILLQILTPEEKKLKVTDRDFFLSLVGNFHLSVTALNNYLRDPIQFVDNNLLRVPRAKAPNLGFGTAFHRVLEKWNLQRQRGSKITLEALTQIFENALERELLTEKQYEEWLDKGKSALERYYHEYKNETISPIFIERFFGRGSAATVLDDIVLTGRVDRVDMIDQNKKTVRVIDYKTGKQKTIGEIEGKTASVPLSEREQKLPESVRGPMKRQLLFYKLLTELDPSFPFTAVEGEFDFVEPDKYSGKLIRRRFELLDSDVSDLKTLIRQVMKEIRELQFLE